MLGRSGAPDVGEVGERKVEYLAELDDGAERGSRQPTGFDLAEGFRRDTCRESHLGETSPTSGIAEDDPEASTRIDLLRRKRKTNHVTTVWSPLSWGNHFTWWY